MTVAISRESGARGDTIGRRVGKKLGWQVYDQEVLEYIAGEGAFRQDVADDLSSAAMAWAEERLQLLLHEQSISQHPSIVSLARIILALGAQGDAVMIGRGAGCILPAPSTLHVRIRRAAGRPRGVHEPVAAHDDEGGGGAGACA